MPPPHQPCLLGTLLEHDASGRSGWLRDELATMIMSGLEPMADALTWVFYLLALHAGTQQKLADEVRAAAGDTFSVPALDVSRLACANAVMKEALRLYPPAWMTGRIAIREDRLGGFRIPKGTTLTISPWATHRDPRFFHDPDEFLPDRWLDGGLEESSRYAYLPFGSGSRKCIGDHFSMHQMTMVVAAIVHSFRLELEPGTQVRPYPALVLRPLGVQIRVTPRP
ncbi:Cytochrome P450 [Paracidovorax anthurii]|uniref:Cytochrome P450 n=2 Tax=Paracidovorax anthurii TaxID=78229 RepID=A0A328ZI89_9BURK|nr:cytochrome P450 [Paracidovorax anthurii]